jgi:hypothetical protein
MLDLLEGYPEYYDKKMVTVLHNDQDYIAMTYIMTPREKAHSPTNSYYNIVSEGYQAFGLSQQQLLEAKARANNYKTIDFTV